MSEGGMYPWKCQKIQLPKNGLPGSCGYNEISQPLPSPPKGQIWIQNESTKEWKLVNVDVYHGSTEHGAIPAASAEATSMAGTTASGELPLVEGEPLGENERPCAAAIAEAYSAVPVVHALSMNDTSSPASNIRVTSSGVATDANEPAASQPPSSGGDLYHDVRLTDTFQGICLRYGISATELRRANQFSGTNLQLAPKRLKIPADASCKRPVHGSQAPLTKDEKVWELVATFANQQSQSSLASSEARAYLELNDWSLPDAIQNAREDFGWIKSQPVH